MCSSDNTGGRLRPKSGNTLTGRRDTKKATKKEPAPVKASASTSNVARKGTPSAKISRANASAFSGSITTDWFPQSFGGEQQEEEDKGFPNRSILHRMLCLMQGMEADMVSLKTDIASLKISNAQQAKELAELRATNTRLERDNEAFREEVELTLEVVEGVVTRNFKQGQELEARVEGYMDVIGDELDHYELRPDTLAGPVGCDRHMTSTAFQGVPQVELPQAVEVYDTKHGEIFSEKHDQMEEEEAFDTLASERGSPLSPASSLAPHKKTRPEKATTTSINVWDSLGLLNQDDESEGGTGTATPSPSASSSTTATSVATLSHYDLSDHHHQKGLHT